MIQTIGGAFSNYYHPNSSHWSFVGSSGRDNQKRAWSSAGYYSYAFINTSFGEHVTFDAGK
ncbi:bacteriocin [Streptococcus equi subsp. zooepidemicus SzAM60]|uniref:lactococcin 972 family bacteriocin n=1 Tax=Streptococcus equi TaxID=1336 RepID=UPI0005C2DE16|nr:lactococcin 972 family bacteriocin [Streptococcus equi]KIS16462.1 bacteriocin [Streptococcus equi subsp. zooepidemicus SzAM60]